MSKVLITLGIIILYIPFKEGIKGIILDFTRIIAAIIKFIRKWNKKKKSKHTIRISS